MRFSQLILAVAAGLYALGAYHPAALRAQEETPSNPVANNPEQSAADEAEASSDEPIRRPAQRPARTLDDLIPQGAVEDAESWAGSAAPSTVAGQNPDAETVSEEIAQELDGISTQPETGAFDQFAIPAPDPIEADPEVEALAEIDAPDLIELPELEEIEISDELILAFPTDAARFPERDEFIERFKALSTIEALEGGDDSVPQLAARARADEDLLIEALRTYGYYSSEVVRQLSGGRRGDNGSNERVDIDPQVRFDVLPGPRYSFGTIDLGRLDTLAEPDGGDLRAAFAIQPGDPLYADRIIEREIDLRVALGESGYPFAEIDEPELLIDHARKEGDLALAVEPNGKYVFGGVVSSDPDFLSGRHLSRIARFDSGETYRRSLQADLRRAVLATGLVSSVAVEPREVKPPQNGEPGEVALDVQFERAPLRTIAGGIGFGTEDGLKVEASWEHRNLFPPEGALRLRGIVGTREQLASVSFKRNNFGRRDQVLTVDTYASAIETEAVDARTIALRGTFERVSNLLFQKPVSWQVGAEVLYTDERNREVGDVDIPRQVYTIAGLFGSATLDSSDDLLDPTRGFRLTGFLAPEISRTLGDESFYVRAQGDASYYYPAGTTVLAGRARIATIQGADVLDIAPSRRLYAGGGGSVRGYGFQGIGPRSDTGEPIGGTSLVEFSLEARVQTGLFDGAVEVVPFVDAGSVSTSSTPDFDEIQVGAGLGVRYKTSFGPIRVDVGVPINPTEFDSPVVVYVSLGQAF